MRQIVAAAAPQGEEAVLPPGFDLPDARTLMTGGIFLIAVMAVMYVARDVLIPLVLACVLKLALQPVQNLLERVRIPRGVAAFFVVALLVGAVGAGAVALAGPTSSWVDTFSDSLPRLEKRLRFLSTPMQSAQKIMTDAENMTQAQSAKVVPVVVQGTRLYDRVFNGARAVFGSMFTTVLMLFFMLASGDTFLRRLVEMLPRFHDKRQAVVIFQRIESDISVYLLTILLMNAAVGILTGLTMAAWGREDAVLWGVFAFVLNFAPIVGPMLGFAVFVAGGLLLNLPVAEALAPAMIYVAIHAAESNVVTPLLLAHRFTLNPVLIVLSLVFWYWMWGAAGLLLATPLLATVKIVLDGIESLRPAGRLMGA